MVDDSPCPPGHTAPIPLRRSPSASFKRLLGSTLFIGTVNALLVPEAGHTVECVQDVAPVIKANLADSGPTSSERELLRSQRVVEAPRSAEFLQSLTRGNGDATANRESFAIWRHGTGGVVLPNGSRLSCGALKKDSFLNLRAPPASSAC